MIYAEDNPTSKTDETIRRLSRRQGVVEPGSKRVLRPRPDFGEDNSR